MNYKKIFFVEDIIHIFKTIKDNKLIFTLISLIDLSFIFIFGFLSSNFSNRLSVYGSRFIEVASRQMNNAEITFSNLSFIKDFFSDELLRPLIFKMFFILLIYYIILFIIYSIIGGFSWKLSYSLLEKKKIDNFLLKFAKVNIFLVMFYMIYRLSNYLDNLIDGLRNIETSAYITYFWLVLFIYLSSVSYSLIRKDSAFKTIKKTLSSFTKIHKLFIPYMMIILSFIILNFILILIQSINFYLMLVFGILLVFPLITFTRLFLIKVIEKSI